MIKRVRGWFRADWGHSAVGRMHRETRHRRLGIERVEDRLLLSVGPGAVAELQLAPVTAVEGGFVELSGFLPNGRLALTAADGTGVYIESDWTYSSSSLVDGLLGGPEGSTRTVSFWPDHASTDLSFDLGALPTVNVRPIVHGELPSDADKGGMIDLTRVINEPVHFLDQLPADRQERAASIASRAGGTESVVRLARRDPADGLRDRSRAIESAAATLPESLGQSIRTFELRDDAEGPSSPDLPLDQIRGSRGRCQTFELAMSARSTDLPGGRPAQQPGAAPASQAASQARSDAEVGSVGPRESHSQRSFGWLGQSVGWLGQSAAVPQTAMMSRTMSPGAPLRSAPATPATAPEKSAITTSPARDAVFAEMADRFHDASDSAAYVDNGRQTEMIPLLAVAVAGQHILKHAGHARTLRNWQKILARWRDKPLRESA